MTTDSDMVERNAALVARVHRLSDPLAAMGQRSPTPRLRQERNARVVLLILTLSATFAITGAIAAFTDPNASTSSQDDTRYLVLQASDEGPTHVRSGSS